MQAKDGRQVRGHRVTPAIYDSIYGALGTLNPSGLQELRRDSRERVHRRQYARKKRT